VVLNVKVGQKAPDFVLPDQDGKEIKLADLSGQWILLYFYPKDNTPGCTKEACAIRDTMPQFDQKGLKVMGISVDSVESHKKFSEKHRLPFDLLSDDQKKVVRSYGVWGQKKFLGREFMGTRRTSFLIDPDGKIAKIYEKVKPAEHARQVLQDLAQLKK
jgi:peroxiredoxin Q/BCP